MPLSGKDRAAAAARRPAPLLGFLLIGLVSGGYFAIMTVRVEWRLGHYTDTQLPVLPSHSQTSLLSLPDCVKPPNST